jgi:hypothetical protein
MIFHYQKHTVLNYFYSLKYSTSQHTVTRIDGNLHQPHRMEPDQTIRVMENNFDICDGNIRFFPAFPMEIFDRFEVFRLNSLSKGWKSSTFRNFPIMFSFHRMEIPCICDGHIRFFPTFPMEIFDNFEVFR